jgi:hypothetical protein
MLFVLDPGSAMGCRLSMLFVLDPGSAMGLWLMADG